MIMFSPNNFYKQSLTFFQKVQVHCQLLFPQQHFRLSVRKFSIIREFRPFSLKNNIATPAERGVLCTVEPVISNHSWSNIKAAHVSKVKATETFIFENEK